MQAVINLERTAFESNLFVLDRGRVVVVVIVLMCGDTEVIIPHIEHRCTEQVLICAVRLFFRQGDTYPLVGNRLTQHVLLAEIIHLHSVSQLLACQADRAVVGDTVAGVVVHGLPFVFGCQMCVSRFTQIQSLGCLALGKQRRVAARCDLGNLVAHGEQIHGVLARLNIRIDDNAFLEQLRGGCAYGVVYMVDSQVGGYMYYL